MEYHPVGSKENLEGLNREMYLQEGWDLGELFPLEALVERLTGEDATVAILPFPFLSQQDLSWLFSVKTSWS